MEEKRGSVMGLGCEVDANEKRSWRWKGLGVKVGLLLMVVGLVRKILPTGMDGKEISRFWNEIVNQENGAVKSWYWRQVCNIGLSAI